MHDASEAAQPLTERELDIATLDADGRTNPKIGAEVRTADRRAATAPVKRRARRDGSR